MDPGRRALLRFTDPRSGGKVRCALGLTRRRLAAALKKTEILVAIPPKPVIVAQSVRWLVSFKAW